MTTDALSALLFVAAGAVLLLRLLPYWQARRAQGRPAPDTNQVDGEVAGDEVRVYYFYAEHCGPCRAMTTVVDRVRASHRNLIKIDIAEHPLLARDFGIAATPGFARVDGRVVSQTRLGAMRETRLVTMLEKGKT